MKKLKNIFTNLIIVLISFLGVFVFFEIFLIWDNYYKKFENPYLLKSKNFEYAFYTNEDDLNNPNISRIFILGDSMVAGSTCANSNKNITGHLNNFLNKSDNKKIKFINLGREALTVTNYIDVIENLKISKNDKVFIFLCENDIHINKEVCLIARDQKEYLNLDYPLSCNNILEDQLSEKNNNSILKKINNNLLIFKTFIIFKEAVANISQINHLFYRSEFRKLWSDYRSEENKFIISSIISLDNIVRSKGASFYIGYYPLTNSISSDNPQHKRWLKFIKYMQTNYEINIFDPYPYLIENKTQKNMTWSLTDKHPSCDGHEIIAKYVYEEVLFLK